MSLTRTQVEYAGDAIHELLANKPTENKFKEDYKVRLHNWHREIAANLGVMLNADGNLKSIRVTENTSTIPFIAAICHSTLTSSDIDLLKNELPILNRYLIHIGKNAGAKINEEDLTDLQEVLPEKKVVVEAAKLIALLENPQAIDSLTSSFEKSGDYLAHVSHIENIEAACQKLNSSRAREMGTLLKQAKETWLTQTPIIEPAKKLLALANPPEQAAFTKDIEKLSDLLSQLGDFADRLEALQHDEMASHLFAARKNICLALYDKADSLLNQVKDEKFMRKLYQNPDEAKKFQEALKEMAKRCQAMDSKDANNLASALKRAGEKIENQMLEQQKRQAQAERNQVISSPKAPLTKQSRRVQLFQDRSPAPPEAPLIRPKPRSK